MRTLVTAKECGYEIADYIYKHALSNNELNSVAESIGYKLGFFSPSATIKLRYELGCLYAFMGTLALRLCSQNHPNIHKDIIDKTSRLYVTKLLKWLPDSHFSEYEKRLKMWEPCFANLDDYVNGINFLAETFYELLMNSPCDEMKKMVLAMRFNGYMRNFIGSFEQYLPDLTD